MPVFMFSSVSAISLEFHPEHYIYLSGRISFRTLMLSIELFSQFLY
jgi:hypothetical protein